MFEEPPLIDHLVADSTSSLMPNPPLLTSRQSDWNSVHLLQFRQPALELPQFCSVQHIIIFTNVAHPVTAEFLVEGKLRTAQYLPSDHRNGCIEVFPASLYSEIRWNQEVDFTQLYLDPTFVASVAHEVIDPDRVEILFEPKVSDPLLYHICLALRADLERDKTGDGFYADSMATAMSAHLLRHYATRKHILPEHNGLSKRRLMQATEYISDNLTDNLSLIAMANELNMSQYYFWRLFKQSTGMTPHQYVVQQRVERAKLLLRRPELTVTDIAGMCGFANQSHFARQFRSRTGVSPQQFRKI